MTESKEISVQSKQVTIGQLLVDKKKQIEKALPKHLTADKLMRIVVTEMSRNPKLKECSAASLISAVIQVAQLGLFPDSLTGEAYLIPYYNNKKSCYECQLQPGYKGLMRLAYNSAKIDSIEAYTVYENDYFDYGFGTKHFVDFKPTLSRRGDVKCYFAIARLKSGVSPFIILSTEEVEERRAVSKTGGYSAWTTHYNAMAKKTAIKVLLNYLPKSSEDLNLIQAITLDDQAEVGMQDNTHILGIEEDERGERKSKSNRILDELTSNDEVKEGE